MFLPWTAPIGSPLLSIVGFFDDCYKMTVGEWLDIWLETYLGGVRPYTVLNYTQHVNNHIKPALGMVRLDKLNTHTIQQFYYFRA